MKEGYKEFEKKVREVAVALFSRGYGLEDDELEEVISEEIRSCAGIESMVEEIMKEEEVQKAFKNKIRKMVLEEIDELSEPEEVPCYVEAFQDEDGDFSEASFVADSWNSSILEDDEINSQIKRKLSSLFKDWIKDWSFDLDDFLEDTKFSEVLIEVLNIVICLSEFKEDLAKVVKKVLSDEDGVIMPYVSNKLEDSKISGHLDDLMEDIIESMINKRDGEFVGSIVKGIKQHIERGDGKYITDSILQKFSSVLVDRLFDSIRRG